MGRWDWLTIVAGCEVNLWMRKCYKSQTFPCWPRSYRRRIFKQSSIFFRFELDRFNPAVFIHTQISACVSTGIQVCDTLWWEADERPKETECWHQTVLIYFFSLAFSLVELVRYTWNEMKSSQIHLSAVRVIRWASTTLHATHQNKIKLVIQTVKQDKAIKY